MKWYIKLLFSLVIIGIFYFIGDWIWFLRSKITIIDSAIESNEYITILISTVSAIVTLFAVLIALFKEDIRKLWEYSRLNVAIPENNLIEILNSKAESDEDTLLESQMYRSRIDINNSGNIPAIGAELYLDRLEFDNDKIKEPQLIEVSGTPINWSGVNKPNIIIPPGAIKTVDIVELIGPVNKSLPDGNSTIEPAKLKIGNEKIPKE